MLNPVLPRAKGPALYQSGLSAHCHLVKRWNCQKLEGTSDNPPLFAIARRGLGRGVSLLVYHAAPYGIMKSHSSPLALSSFKRGEGVLSLVFVCLLVFFALTKWQWGTAPGTGRELRMRPEGPT